MSEYLGPCAAGEDLVFLAHCAGAKDFSLLLDGYIQPHYLSPQGKEVAEWLIEQAGMSASRAQKAEAPSYDVLQELFPLDWPTLPEDMRGMDPRFAAMDVWYSYKSHVGFRIHGHAQAVVEMNYDDELYATRVNAIKELAEELRFLQSPAARPVRFGEDPDALFSLIVGEGGDAQIGDFEADMSELEDLFSPYTAGAIMFFGRPKHTKSWRLARMAWHHSLVRQRPGLLIDPENDRATIARRLAALHGGVDYGHIRDLVRKWQRKDEVLSTPEEQLVEHILEVAFEIQERSALTILGKEAFDPQTLRIEVERVFEEAERVGTSVIFAEQVHKYGAPGLPRNATDTTRIHRVVPLLSDSPYLVVGTTQEKRKENPKRHVMPVPHEDWVFGGDAVAQNCTALVHVHRFEVDDGTIIIMLTPLLGRDGEPGTVDRSVFIRARFGTLYEVLPHAQGLAMCKAILLQQQQVQAEADMRAKEMMGVPPRSDEPSAPRPSSGRRAVTSWLKG